MYGSWIFGFAAKSLRMKIPPQENTSQQNTFRLNATQQNTYDLGKDYSKALRCTFFGDRKNSCSSKFVQLLLLNRVKDKMIKKSCCSRFLLHKFVQLKYFWTQFKNVHLQGPCSLRSCISRPYCIWLHLTNKQKSIFCWLYITMLHKCGHAKLYNNQLR